MCGNCVPLWIFARYHLISSSQRAGRSQIVCRGSSSAPALLPQELLGALDFTLLNVMPSPSCVTCFGPKLST